VSADRLRLLVLHAEHEDNETFSYQRGWPRAFARDARYECSLVNLQGNRWRRGLQVALQLRRARPDAIVLLHSVFSNACFLNDWARAAVRSARVPKVFFIGNEYKLMPEKMALADELGIALLVSQSHSEAVHALYRERLGCAVTGIPNTGFDPEVFRPVRPRPERPIDLGYRSSPSPLYLGHDERETIAERFHVAGRRRGLVLDLSLRSEDRLPEARWAEFLNRCKGQLGAEAGGDFFELTDATRHAVEAYRSEHPEATLDEVRKLFFADRRRLPMRIISGRNVEAAATGTVQLLLAGEYGGYFQPGVHYIAVENDYANLEVVLDQFQDESLCERIAGAARDLALAELSYARLLDRFDAALRKVLP